MAHRPSNFCPLGQQSPFRFSDSRCVGLRRVPDVGQVRIWSDEQVLDLKVAGRIHFLQALAVWYSDIKRYSLVVSSHACFARAVMRTSVIHERPFTP